MNCIWSTTGSSRQDHVHYGTPPQDTGPALNDGPCLLRRPSGGLAGTICGGWLYTRVWRENWLYLKNRAPGTTALHDLAEDIHRKRNVADCHPEVVRQGVRAMHETEA